MIRSLAPKLAACALAAFGVGSANAGTTQFIGDVVLSGTNFCPRGSAPAAGQLLPISGNDALFSLIGVTYGGDGRTSFALPDLRGRLPIGAGQLPGGQNYQMGQRGGSETRTMTIAQMPSHNHALHASSDQTNSDSTAGAMLGDLTPLPASYYHSGSSALDETMAANTLSQTGNGEPIENRQPSLAMSWCIYTDGIYPSRS